MQSAKDKRQSRLVAKQRRMILVDNIKRNVLLYYISCLIRVYMLILIKCNRKRR